MEQQSAARRAIAKATWRLLPFLCLCYVVCFLDRVNVGFAALTMNQDLGFTPSVFGVGVSMFFVGYFLCEVPSNLALQHFGARVWIARIMVSWGLIATAMSLVGGTLSFYIVRFLLGVSEAGFFPGIILYLTYWFPARERARIVSVFMAAIPVSSMIGGPLSGLLLQLRGVGGIMGWQWLFIVQGLPAVLLGLVALAFLDDRPEQAKWLSTDERHALAATIAAEAKATRKVGFDDFRHAVTEPRVLTLGLIGFCGATGLYGLGFWLPQVLKTFGLTSLAIGFIAAIPYLVATIGMVLWSWHSDVTGKRLWHVTLPFLLAAAGFAWAAAGGGLIATTVAVTLAALGIYAAFAPFWSLPSTIPTGTGAAAGFALINSIGNFGGLVSSAVIGFLKEANGDFTSALLFLASALVLGASIAFGLGHLAWAVHKSPSQRLL
jgi:ACS family tartrate transporter-like MFS transporter